MNLETRMRQSIEHHSGSLILRSDVNSLGSQSNVSHVLNKLIEKGEIVRVSRGVFVKAKKEVLDTAIVHEFIERLELVIHGDIPAINYIDSDAKDILVEIENKRVDRKLYLNGKSIRFVSYKKKRAEKSQRSSTNIPAIGVAHYVRELAEQHDISYVNNSKDYWATTVTRLAGDEVKSDPVKDLIIELKREGKISKKDVADLMANYLKERKHGIRPI